MRDPLFSTAMCHPDAHDVSLFASAGCMARHWAVSSSQLLCPIANVFLVLSGMEMADGWTNWDGLTSFSCLVNEGIISMSSVFMRPKHTPFWRWVVWDMILLGWAFGRSSRRMP